MRINILDKILMCIFKKYTYKIYTLGVKDGFNWENNYPGTTDLLLTQKRDFIKKR